MTDADNQVAAVLSDALRGQVRLGPLDVLRLRSAAQQVDPDRVAGMALRAWMDKDPRAESLLRRLLAERDGTKADG